MSEELELIGGSAGIDRRDFIRKTAIVGGMVWAAPIIQSIGSPAFAFSPNGEGNPDGSAISNVAFLLVNGALKYKYDFDLGCIQDDEEGAGGGAPCVSSAPVLLGDWNAAGDGHLLDPDGGFKDGANNVSVECREFCWRITPAAEWAVAWAAVKAGTADGSCFYYEFIPRNSNTALDFVSAVPYYETAVTVCNTPGPCITTCP